MGAPKEIVEKLRAESEAASVFEVWEENWPTMLVFLRLQTQWNVGPMGGFIGLNYQSVEFVIKLFEVENPSEVFEGLQLIESEILRAQADKKG